MDIQVQGKPQRNSCICISIIYAWIFSHVFSCERTKFPFPYKSNGICSWWQFSFRFYYYFCKHISTFIFRLLVIDILANWHFFNEKSILIMISCFLYYHYNFCKHYKYIYFRFTSHWPKYITWFNLANLILLFYI